MVDRNRYRAAFGEQGRRRHREPGLLLGIQLLGPGILRFELGGQPPDAVVVAEFGGKRQQDRQSRTGER